MSLTLAFAHGRRIQWLGNMFDENAILTRQQQNLTKRITTVIRRKAPDEQRKFYFHILEKLVGKGFASYLRGRCTAAVFDIRHAI